ncbi:efflux RND transporter periplasmic adaptor subunit [Yangia mangrovi]|uniref:Efflux RND transporter periplasmic adaptor subunit n=1 Tax=Alloyangia mangrovi TaxID=1779329 RepID=A0A2A3JYU3_9RHOB|nr:efflux RND transporter periplasmic adaptor subunit [Alloyangia mangrovi]MCT4371424.1 efflux RND transporter periplasmic adaptor subunit [Alloyangia mangrovi]
MTDRPDTAAPTRALQFETDRGSSRPFWIALSLVVALVAWMGSGLVFPGAEPEKDTAIADPLPPSVMVRPSQAEPVTLSYRAEGQALPDRDTEVIAETAGTVIEMPASKGDRVQQGDILARLDSTRAEAALAQAKEQRTNAQREFDNAAQLFERGVATNDRLSEARATLAAAEADVASAEEAIGNLVVEAPFAGRIEALPASEGEYVQAGATISRIVDNDPLTVAIQVPQQALSRISEGQTAQVSFITGQTREGRVSFVGAAAAAETRTFLTEIEVANPGGEVPAGISAQVTIPTGEAKAHRVAPSIISLDEAGQIGLKTVEDSRVAFHPIQIVKTEIDSVWVTGLDDDVTLITLGQGFVRDGEEVRAEPQEEGAQVSTNAADLPLEVAEDKP